MKAGDYIRARDIDDLILTMSRLADEGIDTDFDYSEKEPRLVITKIFKNPFKKGGANVSDTIRRASDSEDVRVFETSARRNARVKAQELEDSGSTGKENKGGKETMTFEEIILPLRNGEKVRRKKWPKNNYIYWDDAIKDNEGHCEFLSGYSMVIAEDWEIYHEKTKIDAFKELIKGTEFEGAFEYNYGFPSDNHETMGVAKEWWNTLAER